MEEPIKVNLVNEENPSIQEKEQKILENAGVKTEDGVFKVDLRNEQQEQDAVQEQIADEVSVSEGTETNEEVVEEVRSTEEPAEEKEQEQVIELIKEDADAKLQEQEQETDDQKIVEEKLVQEEEVKEPKLDLPDGIESLIDFMKETGGSLEDYVRLNTDYSSVDEMSLLREYYKQTKSHLDNEEINFLIEDNFTFDEDMDDDRDIRRKKLAYKEEVAKARNFLDGLKGKYYEEIKLNSNLLPEQKEAIDFFNRYKNEQEQATVQQQKVSEHFTKQTENVFSQDFKGFEFKIGDDRYRYKVNDAQSVKEAQSDLFNAFKTFLGDDNMLKDASGYHKALFAARNADQIANHFYQQGQADAIKKLEAESKNINMDPRKSSQGFVDAGGIKVRAISGDNSSKLKVKIRK